MTRCNSCRTSWLWGQICCFDMLTNYDIYLFWAQAGIVHCTPSQNSNAIGSEAWCLGHLWSPTMFRWLPRPMISATSPRRLVLLEIAVPVFGLPFCGRLTWKSKSCRSLGNWSWRKERLLYFRLAPGALASRTQIRIVSSKLWGPGSVAVHRHRIQEAGPHTIMHRAPTSWQNIRPCVRLMCSSLVCDYVLHIQRDLFDPCQKNNNKTTTTQQQHSAKTAMPTTKLNYHTMNQ